MSDRSPVAAEDAFRELVYDPDAREFIKGRWSDAKFIDASDSIHVGRFEVEIAGITGDDFYPPMMFEGWARCCLGFELSLRMPERAEDVRRWLDLAKAIKALDSGDSATAP